LEPPLHHPLNIWLLQAVAVALLLTVAVAALVDLELPLDYLLPLELLIQSRLAQVAQVVRLPLKAKVQAEVILFFPLLLLLAVDMEELQVNLVELVLVLVEVVVLVVAPLTVARQVLVTRHLQVHHKEIMVALLLVLGHMVAVAVAVQAQLEQLEQLLLVEMVAQVLHHQFLGHP